MKRALKGIILGAFFIGAFAGTMYARPFEEKMFSTVFNYIKEKTQETGGSLDCKEKKLFNVINLINEQDVASLSKLDLNDFKECQVFVPGECFDEEVKKTFGGSFDGAFFGGESPLFFVLFRAALNKTKEENEKTLQMFELLLDNTSNYNVKGGLAFIVDGKDFVSPLSLIEVAVIYSSPEFVRLLLKKGVPYNQDMIDNIVEGYREKDFVKYKEYRKIFRREWLLNVWKNQLGSVDISS